MSVQRCLSDRHVGETYKGVLGTVFSNDREAEEAHTSYQHHHEMLLTPIPRRHLPTSQKLIKVIAEPPLSTTAPPGGPHPQEPQPHSNYQANGGYHHHSRGAATPAAAPTSPTSPALVFLPTPVPLRDWILQEVRRAAEESILNGTCSSEWG
jgi:hypothetical protein